MEDRRSNAVAARGDRLRVHVARFDDEMLDLAAIAFEHEVRASGAAADLTDPSDAEIIVVASAHNSHDWRVRSLRAHACFREHRNKTVVYDQRDRPWCWAAGAYTCMPRRGFHPDLQVPVCYQWLETDRLVALQEFQPDLLFSFAGRRTHRCRDAVLALNDPRGMVIDANRYPLASVADLSLREAPPPDSYEGMLARSKFILCPRGHGTGSFRIFEALAAGRVPVIMSDAYVLPAGPDWSSCSLRVPESGKRLISLLVENEPRYETLSRSASRAHGDFFGRRARVTLLLNSLRRLVAEGAPARVATRGVVDRFYLETRTRHVLRSVQRHVLSPR